MSSSSDSESKKGTVESKKKKKGKNSRKRKRESGSDMLLSKSVGSELKNALSEILETKRDEDSSVLSSRIESFVQRLDNLEKKIQDERDNDGDDDEIPLETGKLDPPNKRSKINTAQHRLALSQEKGATEARRMLVQDFHERYLGIVESLYFRKMRRRGKALEMDGTSDSAPIAYPLPEAGFLTSNIRPSNAMERWSPLEIAQFEAAMRLWGKNFSRIGDLIPSKTTREVIEFYYCWKKTSHYKEWKEAFQPLYVVV